MVVARRLASVGVLLLLLFVPVSGKTIILSQLINGSGTNYYLTNVTATNDTGSHTFTFSRFGLGDLNVTIDDQNTGGSSGGNMSLWRADADTGTTATILNNTLFRILSGSGISTSIVGFDIFIDNTGDTNAADDITTADVTACGANEASKYVGGVFTCVSLTGSGGNGNTLYDAPQCDANCNTLYDVMQT